MWKMWSKTLIIHIEKIISKLDVKETFGGNNLVGSLIEIFAKGVKR